jgi:flavin reductase (DIM6/NTAB) family NADH-FMN oxidoreductase RutF
MTGKLEPLFASLTHGIYVVGVCAGGRQNAFTAAWVMQASCKPPMLALSINPQHSSYALLKAGGGFTVNVLERGHVEMALHFGKPMVGNKLASVGWRGAGRGAPILDAAVAWFECELAGEIPAGDHVLVLGQVVNGGVLAEGAQPMDYREMAALEAAKRLLPDAFQP